MRAIDADALKSEYQRLRMIYHADPFALTETEVASLDAISLIDKAPTLDYAPKQQWISVKDRFPDIDAEVLIRTDEGLYDVAQYSGSDRFWTLERNPDCWVTVSGVTHWMPLPEPPKEDSE